MKSIWRGGIRFWLLVLLIPGVVTLLLVDSRSDYQALNIVTQDVYDSALLEPAKILENSVEFNADGSLRIDPPFYAQVMLESRAGNRKYFHVEEVLPRVLSLAGSSGKQIGGRTLLGMQGLPRPENLADNEGMPVFYNTMYRNDEVRMVALWRDLHYDGLHRQVVILVGESMDMRLRTQQQAWREGLFRDGRMLFLAILLVWLSVLWALRPLNELRREIKSRDVDNLMPLDDSHVPPEVVPLVKAVNHHIDLYRQVLDRQARFLADASHQLRTPLAIMRTQAQYAKREPDIDRMRETLAAIIRQLGQTSRLTEQLLSLAHASRNVASPHAKVDLNALAREVVLLYLPLAREKHQDLGWVAGGETDHEQDGAHVWVLGSDAEIHESISNLVHNAINHAGDGSTITVSAGIDGNDAWVSVCDNGVGLDPSLRESVFIRFDRGGTARKANRGSGSGLGLAIALAYAQRNRGTILLKDGDATADGGVGLCAVLMLPKHSA
ncbi:sensor histidine kinase [Pollutimonas nitritireducens]|uniref:sensor histidine kinase n=1 Tax=Pollutimonas nitritireducens TaxID=2045209 RepID=UPI001E5DF6F0|nr:sensor histidine kinase [Pollutimonas nitritireducens]